MGWNGDRDVSDSTFTDLVSAGNFLHFPECGVEFANEVVLPPGVIIPHQALWKTHTTTVYYFLSVPVWPWDIHTLFMDLSLKYSVILLNSIAIRMYPFVEALYSC